MTKKSLVAEEPNITEVSERTTEVEEVKQTAVAASTPVVIQLDSGLEVEVKPLTLELLLTFKEKALSPGMLGATKNAVGQEDAQRWIVEQVYSCGGRPLTSDFVDENIDGWDYLALINHLLVVEPDVICNDDALEFVMSKDFEIRGEGQRVRRDGFKPRHVFEFQRRVSEDSAGAVRWFVQNFVTVNGEPMNAIKMASSPPIGMSADLALIVCNQIENLAVKYRHLKTSYKPPNIQGGG